MGAGVPFLLRGRTGALSLCWVGSGGAARTLCWVRSLTTADRWPGRRPAGQSPKNPRGAGQSRPPPRKKNRVPVAAGARQTPGNPNGIYICALYWGRHRHDADFGLGRGVVQTWSPPFCVDNRHNGCRFFGKNVDLTNWLSATVSIMSIISPRIQGTLSLSLSLSLSIGRLEIDIPS